MWHFAFGASSVFWISRCIHGIALSIVLVTTSIHIYPRCLVDLPSRSRAVSLSFYLVPRKTELMSSIRSPARCSSDANHRTPSPTYNHAPTARPPLFIRFISSIIIPNPPPTSDPIKHHLYPPIRLYIRHRPDQIPIDPFYRNIPYRPTTFPDLSTPSSGYPYFTDPQTTPGARDDTGLDEDIGSWI
jgi:hypothetical protein